jgi:hypothetical protein
MPLKDPKVQLAAELRLKSVHSKSNLLVRAIKLPSQKRAQSGCWHSPHQLVDSKLASANKAKAVHQVESPMLGMHVSCKTAFCVGTFVELEPSQKGSQLGVD